MEITDFTISDTNGLENDSQISAQGDAVQVDGIAVDELYVFESTVTSDDGTKSLRGGVEVVEYNGELVAVTDVYDFSELEAAENNSEISTCDAGQNSVIMYYEVNDTTFQTGKQFYLEI